MHNQSEWTICYKEVEEHYILTINTKQNHDIHAIHSKQTTWLRSNYLSKQITPVLMATRDWGVASDLATQLNNVWLRP